MDIHIRLQKKAIIFRLFDFDRRMADFVFEPGTEPSLRERPEILAEDSWEFKTEQQIMVRAALDIWSGCGNLFLWELLAGLSEQSLSRLIVALIEARALKRPTYNLRLNQWSHKNGSME